MYDLLLLPNETVKTNIIIMLFQCLKIGLWWVGVKKIRGIHYINIYRGRNTDDLIRVVLHPRRKSILYCNRTIRPRKTHKRYQHPPRPQLDNERCPWTRQS